MTATNTPAVQTLATVAGQPSVYEKLARQVTPVSRILENEDTARRLIQLAMTEVQKTPRLAECSQESIVGALMLCAQYDLEPGPQQHVYLIPRKNRKTGRLEANWQLGYLGMVELAARAGVQIAADVVREGDQWKYWRSPEADHFEHSRAVAKRGAVIRAYAVARFPDGRPPLVEVCELDDIEAARNRSEQPNRAWQSDFAAMARKTPVRRIFKWIGVSTLRHAEADDGRVMNADLRAGAARTEVEAAVDAAPELADGSYEIDDAPELRDLTPGDHATLNGWGVTDDVRHQLVSLATDGRTSSSKGLTKREHDTFLALAKAFGAEAVTVTMVEGAPVLETVEGAVVTVDDVIAAEQEN